MAQPLLNLSTLTIARAAAYKGITRAAIYLAIKVGRLPATTSESGHLMVKRADLDALEICDTMERSRRAIAAIHRRMESGK